MDQHISAGGNIIPTVSKIFVTVFDKLVTFNAHSPYTRDTLRKRNNALKCLAGSTWGNGQ